MPRPMSNNFTFFLVARRCTNRVVHMRKAPGCPQLSPSRGDPQEACAIENPDRPRYRLLGNTMAWENRDYNRGERWGEYAGNPALAFGFSVPLLRWSGISIRLSFWLLLEIVFMYMDALKGVSGLDTTAAVLMLLAALIAHDFGHRFFAQRVGGVLNEFLLWPAGGMNPPTAPSRPLGRLQAFGGGMIVNAGIAAVCAAILIPNHHFYFGLPLLNPLAAFFSRIPVFPGTSTAPLAALTTFFFINWLVLLVNVLPFYWFDGGYLLDAILTPWLGRLRAINATCITGMVIAVPMLLFCLYGESLLGMAVCALLFAGSYMKRRELKASGQVSEDDAGFGWSAPETESSPRRKARWASRSAMKKVAAARQEQEKIDTILEKVHAQGMQSLNWMERRALRRATERQKGK